MSNSPCPICGNETAKGNRYCADCDYDGSGSRARPAQRAQAQAAPRRGGNVSLVLLFFVVSAFGTVLTGVFAPNALSLPLLNSRGAVSSADWGEVRTVRVASRIRAQASTASDIMRTLAPGDSVRVEPVASGWRRCGSSRDAEAGRSSRCLSGRVCRRGGEDRGVRLTRAGLLRPTVFYLQGVYP